MEMTTVKTIAVFAIIFGCFAVLYPKVFHPMLLHLLGMAPSRRSADDMNGRLPPHLKSAGGRHHGAHDSPGPMRGGAHPGMRAAAEMKKATQQSTTGGKGMMGVILPMYAVGIVIYLIYTLTKVFGRKERNTSPVAANSSSSYLSSHFSDVRPASQAAASVRPQATSDSADAARKTFQKQKELEKLLMKAENEDISDCEMTQLKQRLMETEAQMSRILQAMEVVQQKVGAAAADTADLVTNMDDIDQNFASDDVATAATSAADVSGDAEGMSGDAGNNTSSDDDFDDDDDDDDGDDDGVGVIGEDQDYYDEDAEMTTGEKHIDDDRNYSSLADEFDVAKATAAETDTTDEVIRDGADNNDDGLNTVRHRIPTNRGDSM